MQYFKSPALFDFPWLSYVESADSDATVHILRVYDNYHGVVPNKIFCLPRTCYPLYLEKYSSGTAAANVYFDS